MAQEGAEDGATSEPEIVYAPKIPPRPLANAIAAVQDGRWDVARALAERAGPGALELIEWYRLRARKATPQDVAAFLAENPDWPSLDYIRKRNEPAFADEPADRILAFFWNQTAQTGTGALAHARALRETGNPGEADLVLVLAWRTLDLTEEEHNSFVQDHGALLAEHHEARLEMAMWRGLKDVDLMLPLVSEAAQKKVAAYRFVKSGARSADDDPDPLSDDLRQDALIAHALFNRHLDRGETEEALNVINTQSRIAGGLGEPQKWASWRRALARRLMRAGDARAAYDLASVHQLSDGSSFADLEWLSGYLALRYFSDPALALDHFQRFRAAVETPISLGRAGYWIGRAQEALGDREAAQIAYGEGAEHQTSFYGLLAAERAGLPADPALSGDEVFPDWRDAPFVKTSLHQAALLLLNIGELNRAEQFWTHLASSLDRQQMGQMGAMLGELGQPHLQVMLGKTIVSQGVTLPGPYYPVHPLAETDLPVPAELALAIARRESEFDPSVQSGAGAQGLMQLMPGTASDVARDLGLVHDRGKVLSDWSYNARLGSTYLAQLAKRFDGNIVMVSAGYNAGPGRPIQWMENFGDPRSSGGTSIPGIKDGADIIDWIEHIPFRETRNYVMRVSESLPVYRARLGKPVHPRSFLDELSGASLR